MADFRQILRLCHLRDSGWPCPLPDRIAARADEFEQRWHGN
jgi:hypothetical protein